MTEVRSKESRTGLSEPARGELGERGRFSFFYGQYPFDTGALENRRTVFSRKEVPKDP